MNIRPVLVRMLELLVLMRVRMLAEHGLGVRM